MQRLSEVVCARAHRAWPPWYWRLWARMNFNWS